MQWNALCDLQIPLDVTTQVRRNVFQCTFCGNHTGPTRARKIVCQFFVALTQWNALCDLQITLDVKTQVRRNVLRRAFYGNHTRPTRA
jgi:hypothetical protein